MVDIKCLNSLLFRNLSLPERSTEDNKIDLQGTLTSGKGANKPLHDRSWDWERSPLINM